MTDSIVIYTSSDNVRTQLDALGAFTTKFPTEDVVVSCSQSKRFVCSLSPKCNHVIVVGCKEFSMELSQQGTAVGVSGTQEHDLDDILAQFDKHEGLIIVEVLGMGSGQLKMWMDDGDHYCYYC